DVFGGDGGISINRTYGPPLLGISFGPQIQVYYLIAAYCFVCTALMYAFTGTPLGRMLNAVRDNPERVAFIGFNTQLVRWYSFIISGFFAGIGGALAAINFEIFNAADALSGLKSGAYLLFTFLGGVTFFFGPIIGAILMVLASVLLSELTSAWLLYLGFVFLIMVMYAPGGVASLIMVNVRMAHFGKLRRLWGLYGGLLVTGVVMMLGVAALIEMIYHRQLNAGAGPVVQYLGVPLDTGAVTPWLGAAALAVVGWALMEGVRRRFARAWSTAQEEIESEIQARGALQ
ncbi:MAG: branched-chain amino acid ABC transporter permease, partial [Proteobacteria bacterium]|nr:branched-chain amino acid ABC transporter permease [Pseudomonadota bacterium]